MKNRRLQSLLILLFTFNTFYWASAQCNHVIVGYWQSWDGSPTTPTYHLKDVPCSYNVVDVAFLANASSSDPTMSFPLDSNAVETTAQFISDVKYLQAKGIKVLASIGGANATITIPDTNSMNNFINSLEGIINRFGFNGLDLDIENGITLNSGDKDFTKPTTPTIVNLITAMKRIKTKYGNGFYITMAPQTANVQGGISAYNGIWGCYLPIIYGLSSDLNFLHVQYYNTGSCTANDGKNYNEGTADFIVAMNDMLLSGFTLANAQKFPALTQAQVAFGLPATTGAAGGGYTVPATVIQALNYLTKGTSYGGQYVLSRTYPNLAGIMTWSTNWDSSGNYVFANAYSQYFCGTTSLCSSTTGIDEVGNISNLSLYPNPASSHLNWSHDCQFSVIDIYNMAGKKVMELNNYKGSYIDISQLSTGMYCIRAISQSQTIQQLFIKQ